MALQARPAFPVPNVTAVITVDSEAMGGGSGYAHRVQLPEGYTVFVADILASMEGLTLGASDASVQARDSEAPPGPPPQPPPPPNRSPPARPQPSEAPEVRSSTSVRRFLSTEDGQPPLQKARGHAAVGSTKRAHHQVGLLLVLLVPPRLALPQLPHLQVPHLQMPHPWRGPEASATPVAAPPGEGVGRLRSETAEECAHFFLQEVVNNCSYLWRQEQMSPQFRMFDPVMFLAWKMS